MNNMEERYKAEQARKEAEFAAELEQQRIEYEEKKDADKTRFEDLQQQIKQEEEQHREQLEDLETKHTNALDKLQSDNSLEIKEKEAIKRKLQQKMRDLEEKFKIQRDEKENEEWNKIDEIKEKNKKQLYDVTKQGLTSKAELTMTNKKYVQKDKSKKSSQRELDLITQELQQELNTTNLNRQEIESSINEIEERQKTIQDKEKRIAELQKKAQELEKFKFVLDYKIKELKRDIGPREVEIQKLNEQTKKMEQEIIHFKKVNNNLVLIVDDLKMRQDGLQKEVEKQRDELEKQEQYKKKFKDDLQEAAQNLEEYKPLKAAIITLHKKYVKEEIKMDHRDADAEKLKANDRQHLEKSVNNERRVISKNVETYQKANKKMMKENVELLMMINDLRKDYARLKQQEMARRQAAGLNTTNGFSNANHVKSKLAKELDMQQQQLDNLRRQYNEAKMIHDQLEQRVSSRAGKRLPPMVRDEEEKDEEEESPAMQPKGHLPDSPEKRMDSPKEEFKIEVAGAEEHPDHGGEDSPTHPQPSDQPEDVDDGQEGEAEAEQESPEKAESPVQEPE